MARLAPCPTIACRRRNGHRAGRSDRRDEPRWAHQIDQALHPCERSGTPPVDAGVRPAWSLAVDGILGPELIRHRRRTGLVPDLVGPADASASSFDIAYSAARRLRGLRPGAEVLEPRHLARANGKENGDSGGQTARRFPSRVLARDRRQERGHRPHRRSRSAPGRSRPRCPSNGDRSRSRRPCRGCDPGDRAAPGTFPTTPARRPCRAARRSGLDGSTFMDASSARTRRSPATSPTQYLAQNRRFPMRSRTTASRPKRLFEPRLEESVGGDRWRDFGGDYGGRNEPRLARSVGRFRVFRPARE